METQNPKNILSGRRLSMEHIAAFCRLMKGQDGDSKKEELYALTLDNDEHTAFNALHVFTHLDTQDLDWLLDKHNELINRALKEHHQRKLRLLLTLLQKQPFPSNDLRPEFIDFCMRRITNTTLPYAIRALCMKLACKQMIHFPELTDELEATMQLLELEELSPGLQSARRQVTASIKSARKKPATHALHPRRT